MPNPSPLRYPGGKYKTYNYIKQLITLNNCTSYIEPFAGGAAVALNLLVNRDVKNIIINDYDRSIYAFWYSVIHHTNELIERIINTEVTVDEWYYQKSIQDEKNQANLLDLGFSTLYLNRVNRSGIIKGGLIGGKEQNGEYKLDCRFNKNKIIEKISIISAYKKNIRLYNDDALYFIDKVIKKTRKSFTFFDPPYFNKGPSLYTNFYQYNDHLKLARKIKNDLKNRKWIVTYDNENKIRSMYSNLDSIEYFLNYSANTKTNGIEYMFFSKKLSIGQPENHLKLKKENEDVITKTC